MELSENYRILYDNHNVILQFHEERVINSIKTGGSRFGEITEDTYHPTIKSALKAFIQRGIRGSESAEECLQRIEDIENKIDIALEGLVKSNKGLLTVKN